MNKIESKDDVKRILINNAVWVLLVIGIIVFTILKPEYFNPFSNIKVYLNIPMQAAVMGVMTVGLAGTILLGEIDLSSVGIMAVSATCGVLLFNNGILPAPIAMLAAVIIGGFIGFVNGFLIAKLKAVALIETLAMNTTLAGIVLAITQGRTIGISDSKYTFIGQGKLFGSLSYLTIIMFVVFFIMYIVWNRTAIGRSFFVVGGNSKCAKVSGINVDKVRIAAFTFSGLLSGVAGVMLSAKMGSINSAFGTTYSMDIIAAAVIGGTSLSGGVGKISGVLGGVLLLNFIQVGLQVFGLNSYLVDLATGLIILLAVLIDSMRIRFVSGE